MNISMHISYLALQQDFKRDIISLRYQEDLKILFCSYQSLLKVEVFFSGFFFRPFVNRCVMNGGDLNRRVNLPSCNAL